MEPGSRVSSFRDAVRQRDQRCIITGQQIFARFDDWVALKAAHVFPLAHQSHWNTHNYDRWITIPAPSGGSINSVQNGILMLSHIHILFDNYRISINPDVSFLLETYMRQKLTADIRMDAKLFASGKTDWALQGII